MKTVMVEPSRKLYLAGRATVENLQERRSSLRYRRKPLGYILTWQNPNQCRAGRDCCGARKEDHVAPNCRMRCAWADLDEEISAILLQSSLRPHFTACTIMRETTGRLEGVAIKVCSRVGKNSTACYGRSTEVATWSTNGAGGMSSN